jgi:hypothetical protein
MDALARAQSAEQAKIAREAQRKQLGLTPEEFDAAENEIVTANPNISALQKMVAMNKKGKTLKAQPAEGNGGKRRRTRKRKAKRTRRSRHRR